MYVSRRAILTSDDDLDHLRDLHTLTFGDTAPMPELDYGAWWLVRPKDATDPVAFCGVVNSSMGSGIAYMKRAGVLEGHRGKGLQRRMINLRVNWARRQGCHKIITETHDNTYSSNNLIRAGFELFEPECPWSFKGALYFQKLLA